MFIDYDSINISNILSKADNSISEDYFDQYAIGPKGQLQNSDIVSASAMIQEYSEAFHKRIKQMKLAPALNKYLRKIKRIEAQELATLFSELNDPSPATRASIKKYSSTLLKRINEGPLHHIKELTIY